MTLVDFVLRNSSVVSCSNPLLLDQIKLLISDKNIVDYSRHKEKSRVAAQHERNINANYASTAIKEIYDALEVDAGGDSYILNRFIGLNHNKENYVTSISGIQETSVRSLGAVLGKHSLDTGITYSYGDCSNLKNDRTAHRDTFRSKENEHNPDIVKVLLKIPVNGARTVICFYNEKTDESYCISSEGTIIIIGTAELFGNVHTHTDQLDSSQRLDNALIINPLCAVGHPLDYSKNHFAGLNKIERKEVVARFNLIYAIRVRDGCSKKTAKAKIPALTEEEKEKYVEWGIIVSFIIHYYNNNHYVNIRQRKAKAVSNKTP